MWLEYPQFVLSLFVVSQHFGQPRSWSSLWFTSKARTAWYYRIATKSDIYGWYTIHRFSIVHAMQHIEHIVYMYHIIMFVHIDIPTSRLLGRILSQASEWTWLWRINGCDLRVAESCSCDFLMRRLQVRQMALLHLQHSNHLLCMQVKWLSFVCMFFSEYKRHLKTKRQGWHDVKAIQPVCSQTALVSNLYFFSQFLGILYLLPLVEYIFAGMVESFLNCCVFQRFLRLLYKWFKAFGWHFWWWQGGKFQWANLFPHGDFSRKLFF